MVMAVLLDSFSGVVSMIGSVSSILGTLLSASDSFKQVGKDGSRVFDLS